MRKILFIIALLCGIVAEALCQEETDSISLAYDLDEITISSTRLGIKNTLQQTSLTPAQFEKDNIGENLPYLLRQTPSLVVTSDDGLGVGYTYFRVRGTDHTRINMTVNGVPLNDSESQTVFWVNMTDMASSMNNINVQRGVGTSSIGSAAFGASVDMQTEKPTDEPAAEVSFNGGMYNTFRESAKANTGLVGKGDHRFAADARITKTNSNGYLYRAKSDLLSYSASLGYFGTKTMLKFVTFGGVEQTYMAWDGISEETLLTNPRYNPAGAYINDKGEEAYYKNQNDNYEQYNFQLHLSQILAENWNMNVALYYTYGNGFYEQYKTDSKFSKYALPNIIAGTDTLKRSDLVREKHLHNHFYGGLMGVNYSHKNVQATIGWGANNYQGDHFGLVTWIRENKKLDLSQSLADTPHEYYRNAARKFDANVYLKIDWKIVEGLDLYGDFQYRHINYKILGVNDEDLSEFSILRKFDFFNPKAAISYKNNGHNTYFTFGLVNREPTRKNYTEAGPNDAPTAERLYDYELGYSYTHRYFNAGLNLYYMDYDNQLVLTGKYSDTGAYLTKNVKDSYRMGLELLIGVTPCDWFRWDGNLTLSRNKIKNYIDWVDDWDTGEQVEIQYGETNISFSPNITAASNFQFSYKGFDASLQTNYVGKQYLDNTSNAKAQLKDYCISNLHLAYTFKFPKYVKSLTLLTHINNLFNKTHYASNGGVYSYFSGSGERTPENQQYIPWYYAQAGINVHAGFILKF